MNTKQCKGKVFRVRDNSYLSKDGSYTVKRTYSLLKRLSCEGCIHCGWINESIQEGVAVIAGGNHGDLVTLSMVNVRRDWETGYVDDYDLQFEVIKHEV